MPESPLYRSGLEVLAFANHKGGVAKTTSCVHLAGALSRADYRVLVIDADPQAQASYYFGEDDEEADADLQDVLVRRVPMDKVIVPTRYKRIDLVPATLALAELDMDLVTAARREEQVTRAIRQVEDRYDFVVIDLPPALSVTVTCCLAASTQVLIPVGTTVWALRSLGSFLGWSGRLREAEIITAHVLGILPTFYDSRNSVDAEVLSVLHRRRDRDGLPVFETVVPKRTAAEGQVRGRAIAGEVGMHPDLNRAYLAFGDEVLERLGRPTSDGDRG